MQRTWIDTVIVVLTAVCVLLSFGCAKKETPAEDAPQVVIVEEEAPVPAEPVAEEEPAAETADDDSEWKNMKQDAKATKIDETADETLAELFTEKAKAKELFVNGLAIYQLTEKGLMLNADIAGTKYWKNKKLND